MKIAIAYRGVFNFQKINQFGVDSNILLDIKENLDNHKNFLHDIFSNCEVDYYFSTYNLNDDVNKLYKNNLNLNYYGYIPTSKNPNERWRVHRDHCNNLILHIKTYLNRSGTITIYLFLPDQILNF